MRELARLPSDSSLFDLPCGHDARWPGKEFQRALVLVSEGYCPGCEMRFTSPERQCGCCMKYWSLGPQWDNPEKQWIWRAEHPMPMPRVSHTLR